MVPVQPIRVHAVQVPQTKGENKRGKEMKGLGVITSRQSDEWYTPRDFFRQLNSDLGPFDLDPCATEENHVAPKFFTIENDGLLEKWEGKVFVNPPYSRVSEWVERCWRASLNGGEGCVVVALLPVRTDTKWFHQFVYGQSEIRFVKGRLKFGRSKNNAPFPSMIVIWRP